MRNMMTPINLVQQYNAKTRKAVNLLITIRNSEVIQRGFKLILSCKARIKKIAVLLVPLRESAIVERFHIVGNDKWNNIMGEAFFKHN